MAYTGESPYNAVQYEYDTVFDTAKQRTQIKMSNILIVITCHSYRVDMLNTVETIGRVISQSTELAYDKLTLVAI